MCKKAPRTLMYFFQDFALLFRRERMHPRKEQGTNGIQLVRGDLFLGPRVIFRRADDKFDFIGCLQVREVFKTVACHLAAAGAFQIHDAADARVNFRNVMRAAGLDEDGEAGVAELRHQWDGVFLQERFAAGQFDEGKLRVES